MLKIFEGAIWSHGTPHGLLHRVPILGPNHGMCSKLNGPGPLRSGGYSSTSFTIGRIHAQWNSFVGDVFASDMPHYVRN